MAEKNVKAKITVTFTPASEFGNIKSGENLKTIFGKQAKWYSELESALSRIEELEAEVAELKGKNYFLTK